MARIFGTAGAATPVLLEQLKNRKSAMEPAAPALQSAGCAAHFSGADHAIVIAFAPKEKAARRAASTKTPGRRFRLRAQSDLSHFSE
jgi:hypothetical protein